ncbi:RNA-guided endonuclease InsQ/TnpB family protein [Streptosporangium sandarakinum]|uniref:RNA-guided endonuclease InsQ/TnpB family protein n=1 Tax=Streptosporangium sandarakinum TaxID=1260955 RepID=UPI0037B6585B
MRLRYRYRLHPNAAQRQALARAFGCARVVFNDGLRARTEAREAGLPYICDGESSKRVITEAKKTPERAWLGEVSVVVLQQALADLNAAYRTFFASITGERKGPKVAPPRFRSKKDDRQAVAALIRDSQAVYVENLSVRGLARTRLAGSVHDAGWSAFTRMLEYKAIRYGRTFTRIDRWFPSAKLCSACGALADKMPLNVRSWTCACGATHDRDVNAAINILAAGRADRRNAGGDPVRPPLAVARVGEAGSHRGAA